MTCEILFLVIFFINSKCLIIQKIVLGGFVALAIFHFFSIKKTSIKYLLLIFLSIIA